MAKGFKHGAGGISLNFKVVCNPQPSTAKENTIWVDTDRINNYYFSATQPENMAEYDVWFPIGTSSTVTFNALKKNTLQVYPISAKQYVGGALIDKNTKSFQNNEWVAWWNGELYIRGNEYENVTGGWEYINSNPNYWSEGTMTKETNAILLKAIANKSVATVITKNAINLTNAKTVYINLEDWSGSLLQLRIMNAKDATVSDTIVATADITTGGKHSLVVESFSGSYYVCVCAINSGGGATQCRVVEVYYE